jgi:hypothetical protein
MVAAALEDDKEIMVKDTMDEQLVEKILFDGSRKIWKIEKYYK